MAVADVDLDLLRQERMRMGTFDDNRRATPAAQSLPARSRSGWTRPRATSASSAASSASPSCRPTRRGSRRTATRPTTSRSPGLTQRLDRGAHPPPRDRRLRRPRFHPGADRRGQGVRPARAAAHRHPRLHHAGLRHRRAHQGQRAPADAGARRQRRRSSTSARPPGRCWPTSAIPSRAASRSTTSPSRTCRPGCAPTTCSAPPTTTTASCSAPATCRSWRSAGAPTASATRCRTTTSMPACRRR